MTADDYKSVDTIKSALGSIARLGRAAATHLALACQRPSASTISTDLKNNIQMSCLLGGFDDGASTLMFDKDISNLAKPEIKGRGFIQTGNEIVETQTYYTVPEKDWVFDENQKGSYTNPVFIDQLNLEGKSFDELNTGWVDQHPLDEESKEDESKEETTEDEEITDDDFEDVDDWDDEDEDDEEEAEFEAMIAKRREMMKQQMANKTSSESKPERSERPNIERPERPKTEEIQKVDISPTTSISTEDKPKVNLNLKKNNIKLNIKK